jgi:DNA polymerase-3 subunit epsilon
MREGSPMTRHVCLDTETTGMDREGDRIIEIGCVELVDRKQTGRTFQRYLSPGNVRVHPKAFEVHGLSDAFLADKPTFEDVAEEFLAFIDGAVLVIHNAPFDVGFLNAEMRRLFDPPPPIVLGDVTDTVKEARRMFPGGKAGLDALMTKFKIKTPRGKHGALLDAQILAEIFLHLTAPKQTGLALDALQGPLDVDDADIPRGSARRLAPRLTDAERERHAAFIAGLGKAPIWADYLGEDA